MPELVTTVGGANSNSYCTLEEATAYFESRLPLDPPWEDAENPEAALIMAARVLDAFVQPLQVYVNDARDPHYMTRRQWTGAPTTTTQRLAWPRIGMFTRNGHPIPDNQIPQELKEAQAELAGQLIMSDTTLDNDVRVGGIKSVSAGSVSVSFKDMIEQHILPDAVWLLLPASWLTNEIRVSTSPILFDIVS